MIVGDFNIHICCEDKPLVKDFLNVIESFNLTQFASGPTHQCGHTLDLVLGCGLSVSISEICVVPILDHSMILFDVLIPNLSMSGKMSMNIRLSRYIGPRVLSDLKFRLPGVVVVFNQALSADCLTENFNGALRDLLELVAPAKTLKCSQKPLMPWLYDDLLVLKKT